MIRNLFTKRLLACPEWEWLEGKENIMRYFGIDAD